MGKDGRRGRCCGGCCCCCGCYYCSSCQGGGAVRFCALSRRRSWAAKHRNPEPIACNSHADPPGVNLSEIDGAPNGEAHWTHDTQLVCFSVKGSPPHVISDAGASQPHDGIWINLSSALTFPNVCHAALVVVFEWLCGGVCNALFRTLTKHPA